MPQRNFASPHLRAAALALLLPALGMWAQQPRPVRFLQQRQSTSTSRTSPALALLRARQQSAAMPRAATANLNSAWQPLGPSSVLSPTFGNLTGRITALATDPNDATGNTLYLGSTGGGVFKSTNAAGALSTAKFVPLTDAQASLSIGALAVQPQANPVVLAGTGDPNDATDSYYGEGILRSTDGGLTWSLITESHDGVNGNHSFAGLASAGIAFSTATPALAVAAFSTSPESAVVSATNTASVPGLYFSTDAGQSWQMATLYDGATIVQQPQPVLGGQAGNAVTAVVWNPVRQRFYAAVRYRGYYSSADGQTWTRLLVQPGNGLTTANCPAGLSGPGSSNCPIFRGALAVQPGTGDLYALTVDANDNDQGLWQDLCSLSSGACASPAPAFAHRMDNGALDTTGTGTIAQGTYNLTLAAAPTASGGTLLFAGTVDLYRCTLSAGSSTCTLRNTTNVLDGCNAPAAVASAQHALAAVAQTSGTPLLYLGNDGGLWRSLDGVAETGPACSSTDATHFDNLNAAIGSGGSLAQVVAFAQHPTDANTLIAGLGANGSASTASANSLTAWPQLSAGEGGQPLIDTATPANRFITIGAGVNLAACTQGSACNASSFVPPATIGAAQVGNDAALLDAPAVLDFALTTNLITATCRVWRGPAASGAAWSQANALSSSFDGGTTPCTASSALVRSVAAAGGPQTNNFSAQLNGSSVLYAGMAGALDGGGTVAGQVFVTTTADTSPVWLSTAASPVTNDTANSQVFNPAQFDISSLLADPHDATGATVYATVMGFGYPHLYRSTDFGAHWLNLSSNLPDAPANAVAVDPNDANTVYIALDTGVYVTQAISTCIAVNCWSLLGTGLPNAPVVALQAGATLPAGSGNQGMLRAATYGRGLWQTPLLTAGTVTQPALTLSATSLSFVGQQVSTASPAQTLTVTSTGTSAVTLSSLVITGDFTETDTCSGQTLAPSATCSIQISFAPTASGARSGQLTLFANIPTGQATVALSGTGTAAASIVLTPTSLTFATVLVNQSDPAQIITVANTGGTTAALQTPTVTGTQSADFAITANTCTATLAPGTACSVQVAFTPTGAGARSASFSITDSAGTQTATLSGTGTAPATDTLSPAALTFAQQQIGTASAAQQVTLANAGGVALTLISASVSGDFSLVNACGNSLNASSTCAISVTFTPTATGTRSGTLTVTDQFRSQTIALSGIGVAPPGVSLTPAALTFPATGVSLTAPAQTLTLTNNGGLPLTLATQAVSTNFAVASTTCGSTLAPNASCSYVLVFAPTAPGPLNGSLTLTTNATPATQTVTLAGTGIDFSLTNTGPGSATLTAAAPATYALQLSSLGALSGNIALSCTGAPVNTTCVFTPLAVTLGNTTPITVTVAALGTIAAVQPQPAPDPTYLALLLPVLLPFVRRRRRLTLCAFAFLLLPVMAGVSGCATDRITPPPTATGAGRVTTPAGTYNLTISASAAGLTHSVPLTLTAQ